MKVTVLALAALAFTGCMRQNANSTLKLTEGSSTSLTISISAGKSDQPTKEWTLTCPDRGTLPNPERACTQLAAIKKPFAPIPKNAACTEVYGGPQVADVNGRLRGRPVSASFSRTNGCEIARWNRVRFLFPDS